MTDERPPMLSRGVIEGIKTIVYALLIALVIRTFLFQPFNIPSGSMMDTLLIGDYLFVSKYSYGYSKHSFPFSPDLFEGRILGAEPARGDVVVFANPNDGWKDYIKRLIGLPGDRIQMRDGVLYVNGQAAAYRQVEDYVETDEYGVEHRIPKYEETLPDGFKHFILDATPNGMRDNTGEYVVPAGHYFMMGDNRDNSDDSRGNVGYVAEENLIGHAQIIFFSTDGSAEWWEVWNWPFAIRYSRLFNLVY